MPRFVSIVIPAHNEENFIVRCLESIHANRTEDIQIEVFVADGRSTDLTRQRVEEYASHFTYVQLIDNPWKITSYGLNLGIHKGRGEVVIILGAHAEIAPDYVSECIKVLDNYPDVGCVGGVLESIPKDDRSAAISYAMSSPFGVGSAYFRTGEKEGYVDTVAFGAYRREVFDTIGYFDETLVRNQDDEFNYRLLKHGFRIYLSKSIKAKYYVRATYSRLFSQYAQYGFWKVKVNRKHRMITTLRQIVPFLFVCFLVGATITSLISKTLFYISGIIMLSYILLGISYSMKFTRMPVQVIRMIQAFFILHLSYGLGYMAGIIDLLFPLFKSKPEVGS